MTDEEIAWLEQYCNKCQEYTKQSYRLKYAMDRISVSGHHHVTCRECKKVSESNDKSNIIMIANAVSNLQ